MTVVVNFQRFGRDHTHSVGGACHSSSRGTREYSIVVVVQPFETQCEVDTWKVHKALQSESWMNAAHERRTAVVKSKREQEQVPDHNAGLKLEKLGLEHKAEHTRRREAQFALDRKVQS